MTSEACPRVFSPRLEAQLSRCRARYGIPVGLGHRVATTALCTVQQSFVYPNMDVVRNVSYMYV